MVNHHRKGVQVCINVSSSLNDSSMPAVPRFRHRSKYFLTLPFQDGRIVEGGFPILFSKRDEAWLAHEARRQTDREVYRSSASF
jgi:hypothetical protein